MVGLGGGAQSRAKQTSTAFTGRIKRRAIILHEREREREINKGGHFRNHEHIRTYSSMSNHTYICTYMHVHTYVRMYAYYLYCVHFLFFFCFCFCYLLLCGDPLSQRLLFRTHTHTHIQLHTTQLEGITNNQVVSFIHTHCVVSGSTFFKFFRGAGLGLNPEHPIALAQHHH